MQCVSNALFIAIHAAVFLVFIVPFSWKLLLLAAGSYALRMWAITAGYHRYFSHRAYRTSRAWQLVLAVLGTTAMQNGPIWWASVHRRHHKDPDGARDPHSPVRRGFWYAHVGWVFDRSVVSQRDDSNVGDLLQYPELRWIDRHEWVAISVYGFACFLIGGIPGFVWGFVVSTVLVFHATSLINSLAHTWGSRRYETGDSSRNNPLLALITLGEGWHNNHHHFQSSARQGFFWWEIDLTYIALRALAKLHIIWDLREPSTRALLGPLATTAAPAMNGRGGESHRKTGRREVGGRERQPSMGPNPL
jgi:stearoyl-CoA desaturase (delta-9 desaturase)